MKEFKKLPNHLAIILDGNGRWANKRGLPRNMGHRQGVKTLTKIVKECSKIGIKHLTVYAFSTENWNRPQKEIDYLMSLIERYLNRIEKQLDKSDIRLKVIGEKTKLNDYLLSVIDTIESKTKDHQGLTLNIAFNYGSKDEIVNAFKKMANDKVLFTKENVDKYLYTSESKDVDLLIRTSGEQRISNYLLWQIAYAEIYFTDVYWPDFNINELEKALDSFQNRKRRFGGLDNEK